MGDAEARQARIEARRRRLAAREAREEEPQGAAPEAVRAAPHREPLSPVGEDDEQAPARRTITKPRALPITRTDHQDVFGKRASAAEGLVDPAAKPRTRDALSDAVGSTAGKFDLDYASVQRASARMGRSGKAAASGGIPPQDAAAAVAETRAAQQLAHQAAVLAADAANRPRGSEREPHRAHGPAGAHAAGKKLISDDEERALHRLMVGPREEADGNRGPRRGGAEDPAISEDGMNAIDAKAMDRLARQNDELRKLAEAQRRELQACLPASVTCNTRSLPPRHGATTTSPANECSTFMCVPRALLRVCGVRPKVD